MSSLALTWAELKATGGGRDVEDDDAARVASQRYAIERFPEVERRRYLAGLV